MISGEFFVGSERRSSTERYHAEDPSLGTPIDDAGFSIASAADVGAACAKAEAASAAYAERPLEERARFLEAIAAKIEDLGEELIERAGQETGLPAARLIGERARTAGQLRLFAQTVRDGHWQERRHDPADPARTPPKPELHMRKIPLGPVAVFGASNFPLAFSVAGGDTASALAAGCPVVAKAHPSHPGTSELVATAILAAAEACAMPDGVFSLLGGPSIDLGAALVADPRIQAVGFTGSRAGGTALMKIAAARPVPIPVFAEMSSINPVILLPEALGARTAELAEGFVASLALGAGQFCTNPGLLLAVDSPALEAFRELAAAAVTRVPAQTMLSSGIHRAYEAGRAGLASDPNMTRLAEGLPAAAPGAGRAAIFAVPAATFLGDSRYAEEIFGATSLLVHCRDGAELAAVVAALDGQLTATLHADEADHEAARALVPLLERKAGRILVNGWPTGVEVSPAMVHGGPFPATSDGRSTSVGTLAIDRFLRPVCYQSFPEGLLPFAP